MRSSILNRYVEGLLTTRRSPDVHSGKVQVGALLVLVGVVIAGCPNSHHATDAGLPDGTDAAPCVPAAATDELDLLFMIDNSNSMAEQQAALAEELPRLLRALLTGDRDDRIDADGDGAADDEGDDFDPIESLHVGVVTSDMGVGGFNVTSCNDEPNFGDDGVLRSAGNTAVSGCMPVYPSFHEGGTSTEVEQLARDVGCVALQGTGGCGFEQPLEAVLKAVTPSTCTDPWCAFVMGTHGHADGANAGFLRSDSTLAVVVLTDEEDCSVADPELFNTAGTRYRGELGLRCWFNPTALSTTGRIADGLLATRTHPARLVFSVIAGVPPDISTATASYDEILAHPRMQEEIDPTRMTRLLPSCSGPLGGNAYAPRRIVEVARGVEARGAFTSSHSICADEYGAPIDALLDDIEESRRALTCD
jgi:hypothetical protein